MADITLPIARPTWPYPNLKAKSQFNPTFKNKDNKVSGFASAFTMLKDGKENG